MKTYVYTESLSVKRSTNKHIRVYRIKNNQPDIIGTSDHNTASWRGARAQAMCIMHEVDGLPWAENEEHYQLRDLLEIAFPDRFGIHSNLAGRRVDLHAFELGRELETFRAGAAGGGELKFDRLAHLGPQRSLPGDEMQRRGDFRRRGVGQPDRRPPSAVPH